MGLQNKQAPRDAGYQFIHYLRKEIVFGQNGQQVYVGSIPAKSLILKPISGVQVATVFNAGTSNVLDIGTTADDDLFATDLALGTANFVPLDESIGGFLVTQDTDIIATVVLGGTAATTGSGEVVIGFLPPH